MDIHQPTLPDYLSKIDCFNRAWKEAIEQYGNGSPVANMLRNRKTDLQIQLIQKFYNSINLRLDLNSEFDEPQVGILFREPVKLNSGSLRSDANHIPLRLLAENLSSELIPPELRGTLADD